MASHVVQVAAPDCEYLPTAQFSQERRLAVSLVPPAQLSQATAPVAVLYLPLAHRTQAVFPASPVYDPASHDVHAVLKVEEV